MKILHTADWHLGNYVGPQCDSPMQRMVNTMKCLDILVKTAQNEQPDVILVAGDIFHQARVWSDRALIEVQIAARYLNQLGKIAPTFVLYGTPNHDGKQQFTALSKMTNNQVAYITEPKIVEIETMSGSIQIAGLPGFDKGHFRAQYPGLSAEEEHIIFSQQLSAIIEGLSAQVVPGIPSVLMAHHTVVGSQLDNGQHVFQTNEVVLEANSLDNSNFDLVCLGHIHKAQMVEVCNKPVYYAGSIDSFTFNDEAWPKGYWMHEIRDKVWSQFFETPYRELETERWSQEECQRAADMNYAIMGFEDKVVRVLYECDSETEKALNKKQLEKDLYAAGAYYVSEIRPEKISEVVNKERMHESLAVEDCLQKYLEEKNYDSTTFPYWLEFAQPIISQVQASQPIGGQTGLFLPLEIAVRNYRSYVEETLSFKDIHFAMVNGSNGSGKSSLFMDALVDCLYEQPREGELTGWIRSGEKSGSISFLFKLGKNTYRVTRTRQRSGKATLAIAKREKITSSDWDSSQPAYEEFLQDISCERMNDTQKKIVDLLGMDCETFKSCVLIMQDQYGSFMEAKPEDRMSVLASLLGLGVYEDLETHTKDILRDVNRELRNQKEKQTVLNVAVESLDSALLEEEELNLSINDSTIAIQKIKEELSDLDKQISVIENADLELLQVERDIEKKHEQKYAKSNKILSLKNDIQATEQFLQTEPELTRAHQELQQLKEKTIQLNEQKKQINDKKQQLNNIKSTLTALVEEKEKNDRDIISLEEKLKEYPTMFDELDKLNGIEHQLIEMDEKLKQYNTLFSAKSLLAVKLSNIENELKRLDRQTEMFGNAQCVDIKRANCVFLREAKEAESQKTTVISQLNELKKQISDNEEQVTELGYSKQIHKTVQIDAQKYRSLKLMIESASGTEQLLQSKKERLVAINNEIAEKAKEQQSVSDELNTLNAAIEDSNNIQTKILELSEIDKKYETLPNAKAYLENAKPQTEELQIEIDSLVSEITELSVKRELLRQQIKGFDDLKFKRKDTSTKLGVKESVHSMLVKKLGSIEERISSLKGKEEEQKKIAKSIEENADKANKLQVLSEAFGQDGIPHQIIRDIVPELESSANEILGQMTGGRMRLEFRTERTLKSNKSKEIATLDIVINDVDNGELPYLARSGGQKVRAALAVSFALAMVKASRVGLQLGMMFVDEPPFLDEEGTEAYCLALQTINNRYPDMRIVAISHDRDMKARFPQQMTIVQTEDGSKVRWE